MTHSLSPTGTSKENEMTTTTATLLPRREHPGPQPEVNALLNLPVVGGYTSDG